MNIGIFGGTFNPPHQGHLAAAQAAVEALNLDRLLVIPAYQPPHKGMPEGSPGPEERLLLTELLFADLEQAQVLDLELRREGTSYTVDTVAELARHYPEDKFYLLMGTDMFLILEQWRETERLLSMATPAVFGRSAGQREALETMARQINRHYGVEPRLIDHNVIDISSTALRDSLQSREGVELLGDAVYSEIIRRRLYSAQPNFPWLRERAYAMLKPKRVPHVQGCEQEAAQLARRWGVDEDLAREAAILHDITKRLDTEEQLLLCEKYGIITDTVERESKKLLHAKTGAAVARDQFGVCDQVYEAILWHTTGKPDMTLLEQVIYIADYIEPTRTFEQVTQMRRTAYDDLTATVKYGLELSIVDLNEAGITPHPRTREAITWFADRMACKG